MNIQRTFNRSLIRLFALNLWWSLSPLEAAQSYDIEDDPIRIALREEVISVFEAEGVDAAVAKFPVFKAQMMAEGYQDEKVYEHVWKESQLHVKDPEFRYKLYEWIFLDSADGDLSGKSLNYSDAILYNILINLSREMGKLAQAEKWTQAARRMAAYQYGIEYDLDRYPDVDEEVHAAFPGLKNKKFPLRYAEQLDAPRLAAREYLAYSQLNIFEQLMEQSYYRGDWKSALLYAEWIKQFSDALAAEPQRWHTHNHQELERLNSDAVALQAELMWLQGKGKMALAHLEKVIEERPSYYYGTHYRRGMTAIGWRAALGQKVPEDLAYLESRIEKMKNNRFFNTRAMSAWNTRSRIWWYFNNGQRDIALELMKAYFEEKPEFWRADWEMYLDMVMQEGDRRPESEEVFLQLLEAYRKNGFKIYEPFLYEKYARWLSWQGRFEEACAIQREAVRLFKAFQMPDMVVLAEQTLAQYETGLKNQQNAPSPTEEKGVEVAEDFPIAYEAQKAGEYKVDLPVAGADLQPRSMHSLYQQDFMAFSHFTLANPGNEVLKGTLELAPVQELDMEETEASIFLSFRSDPGAENVRLPLELAPGRLLTLRMESYRRGEGGGNVTLRWKPEAGEGLESIWTFVQGEGFGKGDFTNAGAYMNNPFYLVPIYQALQREASEEAGLLDFRIVASETVRIEVYDLEDQQPVYIDDQGDGKLDGVGDVLARDGNGNDLPDMRFEPGRVDAGFVIYFVLLPDREAGPLELRVQIFENGEWISRSIHRIAFQKEGESK
ncbi:hypothetical protein P0Y35_16040 [Kiritimatiellaeota bacterium B1221]|nr:hypothetical protein [Kiritimatiellaeota bacterium B1221]